MAENTKKEKKSFFKGLKAELKKVIWPTPKQLINNTIAVVVIVVITAAIVFVLDLVFDLLNTYGVNKLKEKVRNEDNAMIQIVEDTTIENNTEAEANTLVENNNEVQEGNVE